MKQVFLFFSSFSSCAIRNNYWTLVNFQSCWLSLSMAATMLPSSDLFTIYLISMGYILQYILNIYQYIMILNLAVTSQFVWHVCPDTAACQALSVWHKFASDIDADMVSECDTARKYGRLLVCHCHVQQVTLLAWHFMPDTSCLTPLAWHSPCDIRCVSGTVGLIKHVISVTTWTVTTPVFIGLSEVVHSLLEVSDASGVSVLNICWFFLFCSLFCPFSLWDE